MMTYWLWGGTACLAAVRLPAGCSDNRVRSAAIASHRKVPLHHPHIDGRTYESYLAHAEVRVYPPLFN